MAPKVIPGLVKSRRWKQLLFGAAFLSLTWELVQCKEGSRKPWMSSSFAPSDFLFTSD
jgi:hypothetical protein